METTHKTPNACLRSSRFGLVLMACALLAACQGKSLVLTDKTCQPPCWKGIDPGHSTLPQVVSILQGLSAVRPNSVLVNTVDAHRSNVFAVFDTSTTAEGSVRVFFQDQVVIALDFDTRRAITMDQVVQLTGAPEWVYAASDCREVPFVTIVLLNKTRGVYAVYFNEAILGKTPVAVSADSPVLDLYYFDPAHFKTFGTAGDVFSDLEPEAHFDANLRPWTGYGEVAFEDLCK